MQRDVKEAVRYTTTTNQGLRMPLTQSRKKGVTLPTQIRNHLQELKVRALGTSSSKSQKDASTEKPDKGQAKGKVGTSNV